MHFGLKDVGELPSLKEFEEMARRALGSELMAAEEGISAGESTTAPVATEVAEVPVETAAAEDSASAGGGSTTENVEARAAVPQDDADLIASQEANDEGTESAPDAAESTSKAD